MACFGFTSKLLLGQTENLLDFVQTLQEELFRAGVLPADYDFDARKQLVPMQPGDMPVTYADRTALERDFGFTPKITLREGLRKYVEWYKEYYGLCLPLGEIGVSPWLRKLRHRLDYLSGQRP